MDQLILKIIKEETSGGVLSPMEIRLFKFVNKFKKELGTSTKMREFFRNSLKTFNLPESDAGYYHELYTLNYRPEGDYENLTRSNLKDPKLFSTQKRTSNTQARSFTQDKLPFKGSNLEGFWKQTQDNEWAYIVNSYGWYTIYVFKYNRWFEVDNTYSSSTSRQMRHADPVRWSEDLNQQAIIVSSEEIKKVVRGLIKPEDLLTTRSDKFITDMKQKQRSGEEFTFRAGWYNERVRIKAKITSVRKTRSGYDISVDVLDVFKMDGNKIDREAGDFFTGDMEGITKDKIIRDVNSYFGSLSSSMFKGLKSDLYKVKVTFRGN